MTRLVTLSPANHMGLIEHHPTFAGAVREFLTGCQKAHPEAAALPAS